MDDVEHFYDLRQTKLKRLRALDKQAAALGESSAPPHILVERAELRAELGVADDIIALPMRPTIGDELGPNGRFLAYIAEARKAAAVAERANDGIAALSETLSELKDELRRGHSALSGRITRWSIGLSIALVVLLVVVAVIITILVTKG